MVSETESNVSSAVTSLYDLASDVADISIDSKGQQSQFEEFELPEHNEHSIFHSDKTYKHRKTHLAKRRDRFYNA
jgi:hypothetical protein